MIIFLCIIDTKMNQFVGGEVRCPDYVLYYDTTLNPVVLVVVRREV